jgi:hypothetical protein
MAFAGCLSLREIWLPASLSQIKGKSFLSSAISEVEIDPANPHLSMKDHCLIDRNLSVIIRYFGSAKQLQIQSQVEGIGRASFRDYQSIVSVTCERPSKLLWIDQEAFAFCDCLESVDPPSSVTELKIACFSGCAMLAVVRFARDSELPSIGELAFSACRALGSMVLALSLVHVGRDCFAGCISLFQLSFATPSQLRELGNRPPMWSEAMTQISDSVEILQLPREIEWRAGYVLNFGRESKLNEIRAWWPARNGIRRMFLQLSIRSLKALRSGLEFPQPDED